MNNYSIKVSTVIIAVVDYRDGFNYRVQAANRMNSNTRQLALISLYIRIHSQNTLSNAIPERRL